MENRKIVHDDDDDDENRPEKQFQNNVRNSRKILKKQREPYISEGYFQYF